MNGQAMMLFEAIEAIELILGERVDSEYMKEKLGISYVYEQNNNYEKEAEPLGSASFIYDSEDQF